MAQFMMYGLVFDAFLLFLEFMQGLYGSQAEVMGHEVVLMGIFQGPYLWVEIVTGLVIPFTILVSPLKKTKGRSADRQLLRGDRRLRHAGMVGPGRSVSADVLLRRHE